MRIAVQAVWWKRAYELGLGRLARTRKAHDEAGQRSGAVCEKGMETGMRDAGDVGQGDAGSITGDTVCGANGKQVLRRAHGYGRGSGASIGLVTMRL